VTLRNLGRVQSCSTMAFKGRRRNTLNAGNPPFLSFSLFSLSFFSGAGKLKRRERWIVRDDAGVCMGNHLLSKPHGVTTQEVKQQTLTRHSKGHRKPMCYTPPLLFTHHARYDNMGYNKRNPNGSHDCRGHAKLRVLRQNPLVGSEPPRANRARDKVIQRVANSWNFL
jgi:hypothetical protein